MFKSFYDKTDTPLIIMLCIHSRFEAKKLERVLMAYSNHNKNVGYCQGMNMICAAGLLFLDEESAFW